MGTDKTAFAGELPEVTWPENTEVCSAHAQPEVRNIHPSGVFWPEVCSVHARLFSYYSSKCNTVIQVPWLPEVTEGHVTPLGFPRVCACATCTISAPYSGPFCPEMTGFFFILFFLFFSFFPFISLFFLYEYYYFWYVYVIWMWIDWYRKYQPAEPEYEVWWRVSEANESQTSYSVEQADIFQY